MRVLSIFLSDAISYLIMSIFELEASFFLNNCALLNQSDVFLIITYIVYMCACLPSVLSVTVQGGVVFVSTVVFST